MKLIQSNMKKYGFGLLLCFTFLVACEKDKGKADKVYNGIVISMNSECGWCAGGDSLLVTKDMTYYEFRPACNSAGYSKDSLTNVNEWNELVALLDMDKFKSINLNTCYVCADGCDTWITVNNGQVFHKIRFGSEDSAKLKDIQPFVDKLTSIKAKYCSKGK